MLIASDFSGLAPFIIGVPLVLVCLVLMSLYASAMGHWLGPVLAAPSLLIGLVLSANLMMSPENDMVMPWLLCGTPLILGLASVLLWSVKRGTVAALSAAPILVVITVGVLIAAYMVRANFLAHLQQESAARASAHQRGQAQAASGIDARPADPAAADKAQELSDEERSAVEAELQRREQPDHGQEK